MHSVLLKCLLFCFTGLMFISCGNSSIEKETSGENSNSTERYETSEYQDLNKNNPSLIELNQQIDKEGPKPALLYKRARKFAEENKLDAARQDLFMLLQVDSTHLQGHHLLADLYLQKMNSQMAIQTMERASMLYPDSFDTQIKLAEIQLIVKQYEASMETIGKILQKDPNNANALMMLGMNYKDRKKDKEAIAAFQSAVERDPTLIDGWILLGTYMEELNPSLAAQYFDNAVRVGPENISALHSKAFFLQNHEKIDEAIALYHQINTIDPTYEDAYLNAGILYLFQDSLNEAKLEFEKLIALDKTHPYGHFYMGKYYELKGDKESAKKAYEEVLKWNPSFQKAKEALLNLTI